MQFKIPPSIGQNHSLVVILLLCRDGFCVAIKVIQPTLNVGLGEAVVALSTENPSILSRQNFNCRLTLFYYIFACNGNKMYRKALYTLQYIVTTTK